MAIRVLAQRNALAAQYATAAPNGALFTADPGTSGTEAAVTVLAVALLTGTGDLTAGTVAGLTADATLFGAGQLATTATIIAAVALNGIGTLTATTVVGPARTPRPATVVTAEPSGAVTAEPATSTTAEPFDVVTPRPADVPTPRPT